MVNNERYRFVQEDSLEKFNDYLQSSECPNLAISSEQISEIINIYMELAPAMKVFPGRGSTGLPYCG